MSKIVIKHLVLLSSLITAFSYFSNSANAASGSVNKSGNLNRTVLGWEERILLLPENILLEAKFTPGTEGNILHVDDLEIFQKNKVDWVRFTVSNRKGGKNVLEREVIGKISFRKATGKSVRRPVVKFGVCLDDHFSELDISLGDRSNYSHEMVIGRESLAGNFVIDPSLSHVSPPKCSPSEQSKKSSKSIVVR